MIVGFLDSMESLKNIWVEEGIEVGMFRLEFDVALGRTGKGAMDWEYCLVQSNKGRPQTLLGVARLLVSSGSVEWGLMVGKVLFQTGPVYPCSCTRTRSFGSLTMA